MERQQLIQYLSDVFELESQVYTYERIEQEYHARIDQLCNTARDHIQYKNTYNPLSLNYAPMVVPFTEVVYNKRISTFKQVSTVRNDWKNTPEFYSLENSFKNGTRTNKTKNTLTVFAIIALEALVLLLGYILYLNGLESDLFFAGLIFALFAIPIGGYFCCYTLFHKRERTHLQKFDALFKEYYEKCAAAEKQRIIEEETPLKKQLNQECRELVSLPKDNARELLNKLYATNIIFPKYRNLIAVAQMYEYVASGRCSELEGADGAYNLFESELRQNIIINQLDAIIKELRSLNASMHTLCSMISTTNGMLSDINASLGSIDANAAITAYNTQCVTYQTSISNRY